MIKMELNKTTIHNKVINNKNFIMDSGFIVHKDCIKLLETKYGKMNYLRFDMSPSNKKGSRKQLISKDIPGMYQQQWVPWVRYFEDKNDYLLESPSINNKNKNRILSTNFNIIKIVKNNSQSSKYKNRPSPSMSATIMKTGDIKVGNDGNKWIIIITTNGTKRWKKI